MIFSALLLPCLALSNPDPADDNRLTYRQFDVSEHQLPCGRDEIDMSISGADRHYAGLFVELNPAQA